MRDLIVYYSYSGHGKTQAERLAKETGADLCEVLEPKKRSTVSAYVLGSFAAMRGKEAAIQPLKVDWNAYGKITFIAPIWAGRPAPAINSAIAQLPAGKQVALLLVSGSGNGKSDKAEALIRSRGSEVVSVNHIKT